MPCRIADAAAADHRLPRDAEPDRLANPTRFLAFSARAAAVARRRPRSASSRSGSISRSSSRRPTTSRATACASCTCTCRRRSLAMGVLRADGGRRARHAGLAASARRRRRASAAAPLGAAFTFLGLVTGSIWGKPMWGAWWVWDARLTSFLVLFIMYLGLIALWRAFDDPARAGRVAAVLILVGFVNIPIIKFSVDWWNTLHQPASILRLGGPTHPSVHALAAARHARRLSPRSSLTLLLAAMRAEIFRRRIRAAELMAARPRLAAASAPRRRRRMRHDDPSRLHPRRLSRDGDRAARHGRLGRRSTSRAQKRKLDRARGGGHAPPLGGAAMSERRRAEPERSARARAAGSGCSCRSSSSWRSSRSSISASAPAIPRASPPRSSTSRCRISRCRRSSRGRATGLPTRTSRTGVHVVNVWASWCGPCRLEHPILMRLADDKRFDVVGINYKDVPENAARFLGALGNPFARIGADRQRRRPASTGASTACRKPSS